MPDRVSYGRRLTQLSDERGDATAVVVVDTAGVDHPISWRWLELRANQTARAFRDEGVGPGGVVVVGLPSGVEHLAATFGAWKLGASVLPVRGDLPEWERDRLLAVAGPDLVVGDWDGAAPRTLTSAGIRATAHLSGDPLPDDHVPANARLLATSGSTGTPKVIVSPSPGWYVEPEGIAASVTAGADARLLCASPLYHNNGFSYCYPPLLQGRQVILMEHFDAALAVDLVERHRVTMTVLVPTMLQRIARLPGVHHRDLSSLERVIYGGATLPAWVARTWLDLVPPERFLFVYGGSEVLGATMCSGVEWLAHPGTVGRPVACDLAILDDEHRGVPTGEVGQIWMRLDSDEEPFRYVGVETPSPILDGYRSYGDMGWVDADGFLYVADRRQDMVVTGGVNVFPAEVEAALSEHLGIADAVVIGLPDPEWGHRVHAIVQPLDPGEPPGDADLLAHCKARLAGPKVPKSFEVLDRIPRTGAGKINRSHLVDERAGGAVMPVPSTRG